jgi:S1-C subfamily serine protease
MTRHLSSVVLAALLASAGPTFAADPPQSKAPGGVPASRPAPPPRAQFAYNLGIHYTPIRYTDGTVGLRLTADPAVRSPAGSLGLRTGDVVFAVGGARFRNPSDVMLHSGKTTVDFIQAATGTALRGEATLTERPVTQSAPFAAGGNQIGRTAPPAAPLAAGGNQVGRRQTQGHSAPSALGGGQIGRHPPLSAPSALGGNQIGRPGDSTFSAPSTLGGNQIGRPPWLESMPSALGGNQIGIYPAPPDALDGNRIDRALAMGPIAPRLPLPANLGVGVAPLRYGDGTVGLRVTGDPVPGTPAGQLGLRAGDVVFAAGGNRFASPADLIAYSGPTAIDFVQAATNTTRRGVVNLPPASRSDVHERVIQASGGNQVDPPAPGQPPPVSSDPPPAQVLAENLGVVYVPVNYNDGTFGLKLVRGPLPNSPAAQLPLDTDDVIYMLDGAPFRTSDDIKNHFDQTTINYIDASTKTQQSGTITLPSRTP